MHDEEIEHEDEEEDEEIPLTKKGKSGSLVTSPSRSVNKKKQIFGGLSFHLYKAYPDVKELKEMIDSYP